MAPNDSLPPSHPPTSVNDTHTTTSSSQPKLRRLASKLAASAMKRTSSSTTIPTHSSSSAHLSLSDAAELTNSASVAKRGGRIRRRRHQKLNAVGLTPAQIASVARGPRKPLDGEEPAAWLRVRVVKAEGLVAKDRSGTSDPFISLLMPPSTRHNTSVVKRSLNPSFPEDGSTFDFPLYLSLAGIVGGRGLEAVMWDKDLMRKEYMGEVAIPLLDWFNDGAAKLWHPNLPLLTRRLLSTRRKHKVSGSVSFQIGFVPPKNVSEQEGIRTIKMVYSAFAEQAYVGNGMSGVLGVPAYEGIGTIKMRPTHEPAPVAPSGAGAQAHGAFAMLHSHAAAIASSMTGSHQMHPVGGPEAIEQDDEEAYSDDDMEDDGLSSSSSSGDEYEDAIDEEDHEVSTTQASSPPELTATEGVVEAAYDKIAGLPPPAKPVKEGRSPSFDKLSKAAGFLTPKAKAARQNSLPGYFEQPRRQDTSGSSAPSTPGAVTPGGTKLKRPKFGRKKSKSSKEAKQKRKGYNFDANQGKEVLGIVMIEVKGATDLPKLKNSLKFSFDMDPFVVISFGKKVFRTRVIRHSLNPVWDEKLLFHVRRHESTFTVQMTVLDWDKVSGNDLVGSCTLALSELMADAPKPDEKTGLFGKEEDGKHEMKEFSLAVTTEKDMPWEGKHSPRLTVRAKYEPYDALRQRFWRQYITQYDADDTGTMSYTELTAMLDSLGSTLTRRTLEGYFESCGKSAEKDEMTIDEVIHCLEREVVKPKEEKEKIQPGAAEELPGATEAPTPTVAPQPALSGLSMTGPQGNISSPVDAEDLAKHILMSQPRNEEVNEDEQQQSGNQQTKATVPEVKVERMATVMDDDPAANTAEQLNSGNLTPASVTSDADAEDDSSSPADDRERIINIRTCPLCHRPRLGKRSEQDIVTHLAICASADWSRVDRIVTANYVTSSQAQRKFFTKLVNKVAIGAYSLGANSANILVQDRRTGQLMEEKMAVYVRLGIRVLYKGAKRGMEGQRARKLLKSLSIKQGLKYDSPSSALDIPGFIAFHRLDVNEILDPLDSFKTFNEFFYRKLKPEARPVEEPQDEGRLVSCADCRMMAFETVGEATNIWIKGREFTVGRLLGPEYKGDWDKYEGGALGIFRLAPQDYHRFHSPVSGKVGKMMLIDGEYYTVNPQAIRTTLDVYGENVRKVVPVESKDFGTVMTVWIGAMMVGSIHTSVEEGQTIKRGDELGYFAFGGSTIVCLFERGSLKWDEDLLQNGRASIETLVRMGSGIGHSTRT